MTSQYTIIGNPLSPYVRKVLVCMDLKGLAYRLDPIAPFVGNEEFSRISPLRRIPVLIDGELVLNDSTVICEYLQDAHPQAPVYPADPRQRARVRWLEEYCDSRLGEVIIRRMFFEKGLKRFLFNQSTDEAVFAKARDRELPQALDYLQSQLPEQGWITGDLSMADITIASFFRNASFVRYQVDAQRWPRVAVLLQRAWALPAFERLARIEERIARTPLPQQREVLTELGVDLTEHTLGDGSPRPGVMSGY
ncbi:glutathione S-transferase family protein [Pseudoxanthomonas dokdonensis]|uniref:Glutathione S-transferase n=1 Tax=Pseudoxanthomonas dokdonensis TaxID=344882 RepID=A0A0R0CGA5_9GAMM|nr:glutathione S-transferase family protein [Pseudoxanthomonas dokdonensis]KRG68783.1 glutathione S-transferase [Pseudoxanthomonas dokdonensis]